MTACGKKPRQVHNAASRIASPRADSVFVGQCLSVVHCPPACVKWEEWWGKTLCPGWDTHTHTSRTHRDPHALYLFRLSLPHAHSSTLYPCSLNLSKLFTCGVIRSYNCAFCASCNLVALASNLAPWPPPTSKDLQPWLSCVSCASCAFCNLVALASNLVPWPPTY